MSGDGTAGRREALTVALSAEEANAIVYTIAFGAVAEAEYLDGVPVSSEPADLRAIAVRCSRISRWTAINDQLCWCAQHSDVDEPIVISAPEAVLLELAALLEETAQSRLRFPDAQLERLALDQAATALRRPCAVS
jgi:hypothetical protein